MTRRTASWGTLTTWRCVASCWLRFGDDEQFGEGIKKQPIVDQDKYEGEWVALDLKTDAVLSHSRSLADADGRAIEQGTTRVMKFVAESNGYFGPELATLSTAATWLGLSRKRCLAMSSRRK